MKTKNVLLFLFVLSTSLGFQAQNKAGINNDVFKRLITTKDGFKYYELYSAINKTYGAESEDGRMLIPLTYRYTSLLYISNGYFSTKRDGKEGAHDKYGKEILPPEYQLLVYSNTDGFNYQDSDGKWHTLGITLDANGRASSYHFSSKGASVPSTTPSNRTDNTIAANSNNRGTLGNITQSNTATTKNTPKSTIDTKTKKPEKEVIIEKIWVEDSVLKDGEYGLVVHEKIHINGNKGRTLRMIAYFLDSNKNFLNGGVDGYKSSVGEPCVGKNISLTNDNAVWSDFALFMPYRALPTVEDGKTYYTKIDIYDKENKKWFYHSASYAKFIGKKYKASNNTSQKSNNTQSDKVSHEKKQQPSAEIHRLGVEAGARTDQSETPNLVLHSNITIHDALGKRCQIVAFFSHANGNKLVDYNHSYCSSNGQVCCFEEVTPIYDHTNYGNIQMSIPISELHLSIGPTYNLQCNIQVFDMSGSSPKLIGTSQLVNFAIYTYGDKVIYGDIMECSSFAFGLRVGNSYFLDETGSSTYGYYSINFGYENGIYRACIGYNKYYTFLRDDNDYYIFQLADRKVRTEATGWYTFSFGGKLATGYKTIVSYEPKQNPPLLYVAKDGSKMVIENALSNGGKAVLTKEISRNKVLEIDRSRNSGNSNIYNSIPTTNNSSPSIHQPTTSGSSGSQTTRRKCPSCNGTGKGWDEIVYSTCYTGDCNEWCSTCGRVMSPHRHINHSCQTCWGKGYVDF